MALTTLICTLGKLCFALKNKNLNHQLILNPQKILIIRSGAIGDVVMTTPLIKALRKRYPLAEISYLVGDWSKKILNENKLINQIISFPDNIIYKKEVKGTFNLIKQLHREKFDLAFVLDKSYHWGLLAFFSGIKWRFGFDRSGEGFANNINVFYDGTKNEIDYYLELAEKAGANIEDKKTELYLSEKDNLFAQDFCQKNKLSQKSKIIGLVPGGAKNPGQELDLKRWPLENMIQLIKIILKQQPQAKLILFGGPGDVDVSQKIDSTLTEQKINLKNIINLIGRTSLTETAALMKKCAVIVSPDSGPLHLAAASGTKVIALFGPTPAHRFAPKEALVFQKTAADHCPCYDLYGNYKKCEKPACMYSITPSEVYHQINKIL